MMPKLPDLTDEQLKAEWSRTAVKFMAYFANPTSTLANNNTPSFDDALLAFQMAEQYFMDRFNNRIVSHEQNAKNLVAMHSARCADYERLITDRDKYISELQQAHERLYAEHNTLLQSHQALLARLK